MSDNLIEFNNISKFFGSVIALKDVTMHIKRGQIMCLLGDNGAGKSTLIKTLSGVHKPNQGEIIVVDDTKELLKKMGHKKLTVELQEKVNEIPSSLHKYNLSMGTNKMSLNYTYNVQAKQTGITNLLQDLKDAGLKLKDLKLNFLNVRYH